MNYRKTESVKPSINSRNHVTVPVIASFNTEGKMIPLYFSVEGLRIKIDRIVWGKEDLVWGSQYRCKICVSEIAEEIELSYFKHTNMWALKKNR